MKIDTVEDLEALLNGLGEVTFGELEPELREQSVLMRLLGQIIQYINEAEKVSIFTIDLTTEDGWRKAIQQQGVVAGREQVKVVLLQMLMEGMESARDTRNTESD